jgi:hypothetical protein
MNTTNSLKLEDARDIARRAAWEDCRSFYTGDPGGVLEDRYLEAEHCWMFFRSRAIENPPGSLCASAFTVSRHGRVSLIPDYSGDEQTLREYLQTMSDYHARKGF